ncbi:hypothetical protein [Hydrogenivirga sp. 128-5-R1-1]|uniref:hypothetical protein n=1 Tax=Hydrogenivirga sp. 128-5-R1-1 TaxID=392423 RepID=UPI0012F79EFF|nr:hypothetical protein [Hydrogenivirga sp. 128-5-R1-1]
MFAGFLPNKDKKREEILLWLKNISITFILYESPKRVLKTLQSIEKILPNSPVVIAKELTKIHEEFIRGTARQIIGYFEKNPDKLKGEFVILCHPEEKKEINIENLKEEIKNLKKEGFKSKEIAKIISEKFGISKKEAYKLTLEEK